MRQELFTRARQIIPSEVSSYHETLMKVLIDLFHVANAR